MIDAPSLQEKKFRLLGASFLINLTSMLPKLELMCGNRGPFLVVAAMVVMRLFSSNTAVEIGVRESKLPSVMLNPPYVKGLKFSPILHGGWSRSGLKKS